MKQAYETFDGKIFYTKEEALDHEAKQGSKLIMFNFNGKHTTTTQAARLIWIGDQAANETFFALSETSNDREIAGINREDIGCFLWNECTEQYEWLGLDDMYLVHLMYEELHSKGEI